MQTLTLNQLRTVANTDGILSVAVKAEGGIFFVNIVLRTGQALLAKARSTEPRKFRNPFQAMNLLREIGIVTGSYDMSQYSPEATEQTHTRPDRTEALKRVHQAAAYNQWFQTQIDNALLKADNPATSWVPHEEVKNDIENQRRSLHARLLQN